MITFPLWFKIGIGGFGLLIVTGTVRILSKNRHIDSIRGLPAEKRAKLIKTYSLLLLTCKVMLWALPLNLVLVPFLVYIHNPEDFFHVFVGAAIVYVLVTEEFLLRRSLLNALQKMDEPEP